MRFSDIPAHQSVKERLRAMTDNDRLPHALVLEGPQGIGKLAMARALAQYIHCTDRTPDGDSCGRCLSCRRHQAMTDIDTIYSYPVIGSQVSDAFADDWKNFLCESKFASIDRWVEILNRSKGNTQPQIYVDESARLIKRLSFTGHTAGSRIVIMWLPERLQPGASNKLLKMVEEPYPQTMFIMVSNSPTEILPTIYSRLQRIEMRALPDDVVAAELHQTLGIDHVDAMSLAHVAEGNVVTALQLADVRSDRKVYMDAFIRLMRLAYQRDVRALRDWGTELAKLGREKIMKFYEYAQRMIRENFIFNFGVGSLVYLDRDEAEFSRRFARFITERNAEELVSVFEQARADVGGNGNARIVNLDVAIKVILLIKNG